MYKVFAGEKCILISSADASGEEKGIKAIRFKSAFELHKEYQAFSKQSRLKKMIVTGDVETVWKVFKSLFTYIEASGGAVKNEKGNLLMIYRNRHWDLPKGKMEKGESPALFAVREVEEECGIKNLRIVKKLSSTCHIFFLKNECIKHTHWYEMISKDPANPTPQAEEGIREAKWLTREKVKKIRNKVYPSLREILTAVSF